MISDEDLEALLPALEGFHARFARFFRRTEGRAASRKYLIGLALPIERKNVENIAERVGAPPRKLQEFLSESPWDDEGCIGELQRFVGEQLGAPGGVLVLDDTGFAKKGIHSAGVGRQYSGTLGRVDNCQVGVFLGYASAHGHTLVDRRLYLTEGWLADPVKRNSPRAAVPETVRFATKLELAAEMLTAAIERGHLPVGWVTADAAYGDSADLRALVTRRPRSGRSGPGPRTRSRFSGSVRLPAPSSGRRPRAARRGSRARSASSPTSSGPMAGSRSWRRSSGPSPSGASERRTSARSSRPVRGCLATGSRVSGSSSTCRWSRSGPSPRMFSSPPRERGDPGPARSRPRGGPAAAQALRDPADGARGPCHRQGPALVTRRAAADPARGRARLAGCLERPGTPAGAGFPVTKTLDEFRVAESSIPRATFDYLSSLEWIRARENLVLVGPAGTGKSHTLIALGHAAVEAGIRVRYFATASLAEALYRGLADNSVGRLIEGLLRADLVIVDDLGFAPLDDVGAQLLFRFVAAAYERRSLGVASHWPFESWGRFLPEHTTAVALLDRLLHHAVTVVTSGDSYRMKEARTRAGGPSTKA